MLNLQKNAVDTSVDAFFDGSFELMCEVNSCVGASLR